MRGLLLLLPVILVIIILAGSGQAEEEVAGQQAEGLHLEEKAEVALERDAREAKQVGGTGKGKKDSKKAKLKRKQRKINKSKGTGDNKKKTDLKKKNNKGARKNNLKKRNKKGARKNNQPKKKTEKNKLTKKQKRQRNPNGKRRKKGNKSTKTKKGSNRNPGDKKKKKQRKQKKKPAKKGKKTKRKKTSRKNKTGNSGGASRQGGPPPPVTWSDWSSCSKTGVNDSCILNAVNSINFEKNQIQSFMKQKARLMNQNKTTGNKLGKKGEFTDAAGYLLIALGGNISTPACGERASSNATKTTTNTRAMDVAMSTYVTLMNCSVSIKAGCSMPDEHINQTFLDICDGVYKQFKIFADDCRENKTYIADGSLACLCWEKAAHGIDVARKLKCTQASQQSAKDVKKQKTTCLNAFGLCKKAEDAAIALVHTCMAGEINTVPHRGEGKI